MDFNDFYKKKNKYQKKLNKRNYYKSDMYKQKSYSKYNSNFDPKALLVSLKNNKKLRVVLLIILVIICLLLFGLVSILIPFIETTFNYISQTSISGLVDQTLALLNNLWNGSK